MAEAKRIERKPQIQLTMEHDEAQNLADVLEKVRHSYSDMDELYDALARALKRNGDPVERDFPIAG